MVMYFCYLSSLNQMEGWEWFQILDKESNCVLVAFVCDCGLFAFVEFDKLALGSVT